jgi:DNA-binding NarL/FixJ family response regulator
MDTRIRIAIIDDHPLFRAGVIHILSARPDLDIVGQGRRHRTRLPSLAAKAPIY